MDSLNILDSIRDFPEQCNQVIHEVALQHIPHECYLVNNIVVSGMGGSALGGRVLASIERDVLRMPMVISSEYGLPNFVNEKTLVVISSYSGNTRETLAALQEAKARNARIYIITTGGELAHVMEQEELPGYVFEPTHNVSSQPRMALGYSVVALVTLLSRCQLIHPTENLNELPKYLRSLITNNKSLEQLSVQLGGRIPVLLASEHLKGATHAARNQFHENSKTFAMYLDLPEANHHALESLRFPRTNPDVLSAVFIESQLYTPALLETYRLTKKVFEKNNIPVHTLPVSGPSRMFEAIGLIQSGAYLAYYVSQVNDVDPGPIPFVDWFKDEMKKLS